MVTLPHERRRALDALPGVATLILDAAARAMRLPNVAYVRIPADLIRALGAALRHYPTRSEVDCYWREDEAAEIAALREQVRQAAEVLQQLRCEMRPSQVQWHYDWLSRPTVRRALEEER